jgi:hypothetical protein
LNVRPRKTLGCAFAATWVAAALASACSQGQGTGVACGTLDVQDCWTGSFNLQPNFFAAVPTQSTSSTPVTSLQIRLQNGANYESFSDGIAILVDDISKVKAAIGQTLQVALPVGVTPPGVPIVANPNPAYVHASLYLQKSCRPQDVALYALAAVSLNADGSCGQAGPATPQNACALPLADGAVLPSDAGDGSVAATLDASTVDGSSSGADGGASSADGGVSSAPGPVGVSTIVFDRIFNGDPNANAGDRLTSVPMFDFYFADPRDIAPGGLGPPPPCQAHLAGNFSFYFERGQPEQPFP